MVYPCNDSEARAVFFFLFPSLFSSLIIIGRKISESFEGEKEIDKKYESQIKR